MRIGIDIRSLSANRHSGVEEYIYNLLPALFRAGREDQFILLYNSWKFSLTAEITNWESFSNVSIVEYRLPSKLLNAALWSIKKPRLDKLLGNIDVMFLPNITFFSVSESVPYVVTFHDISFEFFPNFFNLYRRIWHFLVNPREKALQAKQIITVSNSTAQDIAEVYRITQERISPIYLGLSPIFFGKPETNNFLGTPYANTAEEWRIRKIYKIPEFPFILYFGTIEPRKNLVSLVKAYDEFRKKSKLNYSLVIAGSKGWSYKEIFQAARLSPFRRDIRFIGTIANKDRPVLYKMAQLFIFPSFFEGFGLPPLEALASGTPTICSGSTSLLEVFGSHTLMVNPHDPSEIAWAIERALTDERLRELLINEGKKYALGFSWTKTARETLEVLHKAARTEI